MTDVATRVIILIVVAVLTVIVVAIVTVIMIVSAIVRIQKKKKQQSNLKTTKNMSRKSRFLVGLIVAALTFGGLWATIGSEKFNSCRPCHRMHHCSMHEGNNRHCDESTKVINAEKVIVIKEVTKTDSVK